MLAMLIIPGARDRRHGGYGEPMTEGRFDGELEAGRGGGAFVVLPEAVL
ncbi:MAG TPA: hypothetical protein VHJ39_17300 [Solirubrobacteraceae bacterium]|jgi:hypothetical protein|nr:hypothetical protein [Solirubrobacteraceae bacterium]